MPKKQVALAALLASLLLTSNHQLLAEEPESPEKKVNTIGAPLAFSSDDWGTALGASGLVTGLWQPQLSIFGTAIASTNGTWMGFVGINNIMIPGQDQWLVDLYGTESRYKETSYYVSGNPDYLDQQAGSNDSSADNYIRSESRTASYWARFRYIVPIGAGRDGAMASLRHRGGNSNNGGKHWDPLSSGITTLELQPFYQRRELRDITPENDDTEAMGVRLIADYDNRNSTQLPTRGSHTTFTYSNDWGSSDRPSWSTWEFEYSTFFNLGDSDEYLRQKVLALNAWIADTPTWNDTETVGGEQRYRRPPSFAGVSLGGWDKMRGYDSNRFYGRSAVSYSAELRLVPDWQPLQDLPVIGSAYNIPWWQWALFVDVGRVSDTFSLSELHSDMKTSVGGSIRFKVEAITVRTEVAASEEGGLFRVFINQPF